MRTTVILKEQIAGLERYAESLRAQIAQAAEREAQAVQREREAAKGLVDALAGVLAIIRINTKSEHIHPIYAEDTRYKHAVKLLKAYRATQTERKG